MSSHEFVVKNVGCELLRVTADGRVIVYDRDGNPHEIDGKALYDVLRKYHSQ
jgi:hypothetical protein